MPTPLTILRGASGSRMATVLVFPASTESSSLVSLVSLIVPYMQSIPVGPALGCDPVGHLVMCTHCKLVEGGGVLVEF